MKKEKENESKFESQIIVTDKVTTSFCPAGNARSSGLQKTKPSQLGFNSSNSSCAKPCFLFALALVLVIVMGVGVRAAACNADFTAIESDSCILPSSLTLNGSYVRYINGNSSTNAAIRITGNNLILDCNGTTLIGNSTSNLHGILRNAGTNVTIKNCILQNYDRGISLGDGLSMNVTNVTILNSTNGIYLTRTDNSSISSNYISTIGSGVITTDEYNEGNAILNNQLFSRVLIYRGFNYTLSHNLVQDVKDNDGLSVINSSYFEISHNTFLNMTKYDAMILSVGTHDITVLNNTINLTDTGIWVRQDAYNIYVINSTFDRLFTNYDGYSLAVQTERNVTNIVIDGNTVYPGNMAFLIRTTNGAIIRNNNILRQTNTYYIINELLGGDEPFCEIGVQQLYKGWLGDGSESIADNRTNKIQNYSSNNVSIYNNTYNSNVQCYFRTQGTTNLSHDLSDYRLFSWQLDYLLDRDDLYINSAFSNLSNVNNSLVVSNIFYQEYIGSSNGKRILYKWNNTVQYFKNVNNTQSYKTNLYNITLNNSIFDITNSRYLFTSTSASRNSFNVTLAPNQEIQVQDYGCTVPFDGMTIAADTTVTLCNAAGSDHYNLNVTNGFWAIALKNNATLDCNGVTIYGNYSAGAGQYIGISYVGSQANNTIIKNCTINNYYTGIKVNGYNNSIVASSAFDNSYTGYYVGAGSGGVNNTINSSKANSSTYGIITYANYTTILNNEFIGTSTSGVYLESEHNNITTNRFLNMSAGKGISLNGKDYNFVEYNNFSHLPQAINTATNGSYNKILHNSFYNCSQYQCIFDYDTVYNEYAYNNFNLMDKAIAIGNISAHLMFHDNYLNASILGYDYWLAGVLGYPSPTGRTNNVSIYNNVMENMGCQGIILHRGDNWKIINNSISRIPQSLQGYNNRGCTLEVPSAIAVVEIKGTYVSDSSENETDNRTNKIGQYNSTNTLIANNTFAGWDVLVMLQGAVNTTHDLTDYKYISYQFPEYLVDRTELFLRSDFNNVSTTSASGVFSSYVQTGWRGIFTSKMLLSRNYQYYENKGNVNYSGLKVFDQTSSLAYLSNGSLACPGTGGSSLVTGTCNITLQPSNWSYVYDNYSIDERRALYTGEPIWISSKVQGDKKTTWHIASNLTDTLNGTRFYFKPYSCNIDSATYTSNSSNYSKTFSRNEISCTDTASGPVAWVTLNVIEPATGSNEFTANYFSQNTGGAGGATAPENTTQVSQNVTSQGLLPDEFNPLLEKLKGWLAIPLVAILVTLIIVAWLGKGHRTVVIDRRKGG